MVWEVQGYGYDDHAEEEEEERICLRRLMLVGALYVDGEGA